MSEMAAEVAGEHNWIIWALGTVISALSGTVVFVYRALSTRADRLEATQIAFAASVMSQWTESQKDRRELAVQIASLLTRTNDQYDSIMRELNRLNSQISNLALNKEVHNE